MNVGEDREQQLGEQAQREVYGRSFRVAPQWEYLVVLCLAAALDSLFDRLCPATQRLSRLHLPDTSRKSTELASFT